MKVRASAFLALAFALLVGSAWAASDPMDGWGRDGDYNKLFNPSTVQTITGKVVSVDREFRPLPQMGAGVAAVIETADGKQVQVQVGPIWFTEYFRRQWNVEPGDQVEVRGSMVQVAGKPAMMVVWGKKGDLQMAVRNQAGIPVWDLDIADF